MADGRDQRVVVVTGGGAGIGASIAEELGRRGDHVVTLDPLVTLDGSEQLPAAEETTAGRIVAAGGSARASSASVTDAEAVRELFAGLVAEFGRLDAVVNVAGITRPTSFTRGTDDDWRAVLSVHLGGYLNVLSAALPHMAAAGHGRIVGVTSGSGWRAADTGAYGCAKRAVAALTWQLGAQAPPGVAVNAMSPIAVTRMVTAALGRAARPGGSGQSTGGLSLGAMPDPAELGPTGAYLVADEIGWCRGQVVFAAGSELAVVDRPRLLEVVRTDDVSSLPAVLDAVTAGALVPAETGQVSTGGGNPRFREVFATHGGAAPPAVGSAAVVTDVAEVGAAVVAALAARGVPAVTIDPGVHAAGFTGAASALASFVDGEGPIDAVVVALSGDRHRAGADGGWERTLAEHEGLVDAVHADAGWARAVADHAAATDGPVRLVTLVDASTAGGHSRAQAAAQHSRAAVASTGERVAAFAVAVEDRADPAVVAGVAAHLLCSPDTPALSGAELVAGDGWLGLRSHPRPGGSVVFGGPAVPRWLDATLRRIVHPDGVADGPREERP